jgi:gamma-glutamylcyclotransferase (GGCT)/AIG2-like uncharacterized protein YtfP
MTHHVFTYGSLMFLPVWQRVVRGTYRSSPALLRDYARYKIAGEIYPAMVAQQGKSVSGIVYFDVAADDIGILDKFESSDYQRVSLQAQIPSGEIQTVEGYGYLHAQRLTAEEWVPESFQLQQFLQTYC